MAGSIRSTGRQSWRVARLRFAALVAAALASGTLGSIAAQAQAAAPTGAAKAYVTGKFGDPVPWTINGLHEILLPSGKVLSYGTNQLGQQGGQFNYDVWDPSLGTGLDAHLLLPNTTAVDIFCSGQAIIPSSGNVLITGGDQTIGTQRNYSTNQTEIFSEKTALSNQPILQPETAMTYARWYPSLVTMPNGTMVAIGGRSDQFPNVAVATPELYTPGSGWKLLPAINPTAVFAGIWYYPRAFVAPNGQIFILSIDGSMFYMGTTGQGSFNIISVPRTLKANNQLPTLMFAPGKVLSLRFDRKVILIDLNATPKPTIQQVGDIDQNRFWSTMTVMADGKVLLSGGSEVANTLTGVAYSALIWDPTTGQWTTGASAKKARLYHSISLLLPDATVLTGAGGAPGPISNLNAEIYYPPYLYKKDGTGQAAPRPTFTTGWDAAKLGQVKGMAIGLRGGKLLDTVSRVTLVRLGSDTHTYNSEQRILDVNFSPSNTVSGRDYQLTLPSDPNRAVPGYYMLFVFNQDGVPSVAKIIRLTT